MSSKLTPIGNRVLVKQIEAETKTASGILLSADAATKSEIAEVISVGSNVRDIKKGDKVVYKSYSSPIKIDGEEYLILTTDTDDKDGDILAIITN